MDKRLSFDRVPEIYDRARPTYPAALFDALLGYASGRKPRVVEIGPGTGQATGSLLERGARVTAVELGPNLARFLRKKLEADRCLDVVNTSFEDAALPDSAFDLVIAATAWAWLDPAVRVLKSHRLLRPRGALGVISTNQIRSAADGGYFERVQPIYRRYDPEDTGVELPGEDVAPAEVAEIESSGLFDQVRLYRHRWDQTYTSQQYADLVRSYSGTQLMRPATAEALIAELCRVIDEEFGGLMVRPLVVTLTVGRKLAV